MAKRKFDNDIGKRMTLECLRLFPTNEKAAASLGVSVDSIYRWQYGQAPSAAPLARLHYAGGDVIYVLTGRKGDDK